MDCWWFDLSVKCAEKLAVGGSGYSHGLKRFLDNLSWMVVVIGVGRGASLFDVMKFMRYVQNFYFACQ